MKHLFFCLNSYVHIRMIFNQNVIIIFISSFQSWVYVRIYIFIIQRKNRGVLLCHFKSQNKKHVILLTTHISSSSFSLALNLKLLLHFPVLLFIFFHNFFFICIPFILYLLHVSYSPNSQRKLVLFPYYPLTIHEHSSQIIIYCFLKLTSTTFPASFTGLSKLVSLICTQFPSWSSQMLLELGEEDVWDGAK